MKDGIVKLKLMGVAFSMTPVLFLDVSIDDVEKLKAFKFRVLARRTRRGSCL